MSADPVFTYGEALALFPTVRDRTDAAVREVEAITNRISSLDEAERSRDRVEDEIQAVVGRWAEEIMALGCEVKGLWLVDWDSGDGYYCWRYPEETIGYFHSYEEGFAGRLPIA